jgi:hypothetical protein
MTGKIFVVACLLGLLVSSNMAWSAARWSRGDCINAVNQKFGVRATDAGGTTNKAAVQRCLKHGPDSI